MTLHKFLFNTINECGPLSIDVIFAHAVQYYYKTKQFSNDFFTAPISSQMFCHAVAVWVYNTINTINSNNITLIELGAGSGVLISTIIQFIQNDKEYIAKIKQIILIETSALLIEKQKIALAPYNISVIWLSDIADLKMLTGPLIVVANEFFDALPIKQFIKTASGFRELMVGIDENNQLQLVQSNQTTHIQLDEEFKKGEIYEISNIAIIVLQTFIQLFKSFGGAGLIIDYGYFNYKKRNTIQAIYKHQILNSFLDKLGDADISAQVNFKLLKSILRKNNLDIKYGTQSEFLKKNHIDYIVAKALKHAKTQLEFELISAELNRISIDMGEVFKVIEIYNP